MALIKPTHAFVGGDQSASLWTWNLTTADHTGSHIEQVQNMDLCWQSFATNQGGMTVSTQGSNDGTNWFALTNASGGSAATFAADGGKQTVERPRYVRPSASGAAGAASVVAITLLARKNPVK
jgi:hypothetical protein